MRQASGLASHSIVAHTNFRLPQNKYAYSKGSSADLLDHIQLLTENTIAYTVIGFMFHKKGFWRLALSIGHLILLFTNMPWPKYPNRWLCCLCPVHCVREAFPDHFRALWWQADYQWEWFSLDPNSSWRRLTSIHLLIAWKMLENFPLLNRMSCFNPKNPIPLPFRIPDPSVSQTIAVLYYQRGRILCFIPSWYLS